MSIIKEQIKYEELDAEISVLEKIKGEHFEPFEIIDLDVDNMRSYTPNDLIKLGEWLIENATRIKIQYTSTGMTKDIAEMSDDDDKQVKNIEEKTDFVLELLGDFSDHLKEDYGVVVPEKAFVTFLEV